MIRDYKNYKASRITRDGITTAILFVAVVVGLSVSWERLMPEYPSQPECGGVPMIELDMPIAPPEAILP